MLRYTAKTTKKIVLRLECVACKTKAQLSLKRCKHFELGFVTPTRHYLPRIPTNAPSTTVVTRRPRVPLLFSKRLVFRVRVAEAAGEIVAAPFCDGQGVMGVKGNLYGLVLHSWDLSLSCSALLLATRSVRLVFLCAFKSSCISDKAR